MSLPSARVDVSDAGDAGDGGAAGEGGMSYSLACVVLHHGDKMDSGHYSTLLRGTGTDTSSGDWCHANDARITQITEENALMSFKQEAYILFYNKNL